MGIRDFQTLDNVVTIRDATLLWEDGYGGAWSSWMMDRYVRGQNFDSITPKLRDSTCWKSIVKAKDKICLCLNLGVG